MAYTQSLHAQMIAMQNQHKEAIKQIRVENDAHLKVSKEKNIQLEACMKAMEEALAQLS